MTISDLYVNARAIDILDIVRETLLELGDTIITLNQFRLFDKSEDADGEPLEFYRSIAYSIIKNQINPSPGFGRPDLKDTGDFYRGFNLTVTEDEFEIDSTDEKSTMLKSKYGDKIFGLTNEELEAFSSEAFNKLFIEKVKQALAS